MCVLKLCVRMYVIPLCLKINDNNQILKNTFPSRNVLGRNDGNALCSRYFLQCNAVQSTSTNVTIEPSLKKWF